INEPVRKETPRRMPKPSKMSEEIGKTTERATVARLGEKKSVEGGNIKKSKTHLRKQGKARVKSSARQMKQKKSGRAAMPAAKRIRGKKGQGEKIEFHKMKIPTGVKGLDALLSGGIEEGTSFIIYGTPHCGKKPVIMQMAYTALKNKIPVIFVLTDFGVKRWKEMMAESGWNTDRFKDRVFFIDAYSQQYSIMKNEENITYLQVPFSLSTLSIECTKFIETCELVWKRKPLVIMHSISTLIQSFGEAEVFSFMQFFLGKLSNNNITSVHTLQSGMHTEKIETMIVSNIDGVLEMRDMKLRARGFLDIKTQDWIPYRMTPRGIVVDFKEETSKTAETQARIIKGKKRKRNKKIEKRKQKTK
ncbi:MAG: RAD55 family ATPase, partial [Candidatus Micrarchaeia archaeon]